MERILETEASEFVYELWERFERWFCSPFPLCLFLLLRYRRRFMRQKCISELVLCGEFLPMLRRFNVDVYSN